MAGVRSDFLAFIEKNEICKDEIRKSIANTNALGHLTRIFNDILFFNDQPMDKNIEDYLANIKRGTFPGWVCERTLTIVDMLLNPDGTLKQDVLHLFAKAAALTDDEMKTRLYGDPLNPDRIKQVANMIVSSAVTAISLVLSGLMRQNPALRKMDYYITNLKDGEPVDDRLVTFKTLSRQLSFDELMRYKDRGDEVKKFIDKTENVIRYNNDLLERLGVRTSMILILNNARKSIDEDTVDYRPAEMLHTLLKKTLTPYQHSGDIDSQRAIQHIIREITGIQTRQNVICESISMRLSALETIMMTNAKIDEDDEFRIPLLHSELEKLARHSADKETFAELAKNVEYNLKALFGKYLPQDSDLYKQYEDCCQKFYNGTRFADDFEPKVTMFKQSLDHIKKQAIELNENELANQSQLRK